MKEKLGRKVRQNVVKVNMYTGKYQKNDSEILEEEEEEEEDGMAKYTCMHTYMYVYII